MVQLDRDDGLFPKFHQWRQGFQGPALTLWSYLNARADIEVVGAAATLFWPTVLEHERCFILREQFSESTFAQWREQFHGDCAAIERMMNHVHLIDLFVNSYDDSSIPTLGFIGQIMTRCWRCALDQQFPDRRFEVQYAADADGNGPTVTFFQRE